MNTIEKDRLEKIPNIGYDNLYYGVSSYIDVKNFNLFWSLHSGYFVNDVLIANDIPFKEFNYYDGYAYKDRKEDDFFLKENTTRIRIYYVIESEISKEKLDLIYQISNSKSYFNPNRDEHKDFNEYFDYKLKYGTFDNQKVILNRIDQNYDKKEYYNSKLSTSGHNASHSFFVVLKEDSFDGFPKTLKKSFREYEGSEVLATPSLMPKLFFSCLNCSYMFKGVKNKNSSVVIGSNSIFSSNSYREYADLLLHEGSVFIGDNSYFFYKKESFFDREKGLFVVDYDKQKIGNNILIGKHSVVNAKYIGDNATIGSESVVENYCSIGNNAYIQSGVKISQYTEIGAYSNVSVNPNKILGYGYHRSTDANYTQWIKELTWKSAFNG